MKRFRSFFIVVFIAVFAFAGCTVTGDIQKQKMKVAVIVKSENSFFWQTVFSGIEAAKNEYTNLDLEVLVMAPEREDDYLAQNEFIKEAINVEKVNALVFSASDYQKSSDEIKKAQEEGVRVVTIDSGIETTDFSVPYIGTDNYAAGRQAGEAMAELLGGEGTIGVISFEEDTGNGQQRVKGLNAFIDQNPSYVIVKTLYALSNEEDPNEKTKQMLEEYPNLDGIVTFNELTTLGVGQAIQELEMENDVAVVGFDNHERCIAMLESGALDALIVQNPFAMGYLGLQSVIEEFTTGKTMENIDTPTDVITKENMYDITKQRILFPVVNRLSYRPFLHKMV